MLVWCSRAAARASRRNRCSRSGSPPAWAGQHLQGDVPAQRHLLGLVDHAHAAAADLAQDAVVAELLRRRSGAGGRRDARLGPGRLDLLHHHQGREQVADLVGQLRVGGRCTRSGPAARRGGAGPGTPRPAARPGPAGRRSSVMASALRRPPGSSGPPARIALSRRRARTNRWLAAASPMPSTWAVSALVSSSKCRRASTSRSIGSMPLSASWTPELQLGLDGRLAGAGVAGRGAARPATRSWPAAAPRGAATPPGRRPGPGCRGGGGAGPGACGR